MLAVLAESSAVAQESFGANPGITVFLVSKLAVACFPCCTGAAWKRKEFPAAAHRKTDRSKNGVLREKKRCPFSNPFATRNECELKSESGLPRVEIARLRDRYVFSFLSEQIGRSLKCLHHYLLKPTPSNDDMCFCLTPVRLSKASGTIGNAPSQQLLLHQHCLSTYVLGCVPCDLSIAPRCARLKCW